MGRILRRTGLVAAAIVMAWSGGASGQNASRLDISGDIRLRLEEDWAVKSALGVPRNDRGRDRIRVRVNAALDLGKGLKLAGRVRTGGTRAQQNANITFADFNGNPVEDLRITPDRYSLSFRGKQAGAEIGRMAFPFTTPNEYFWDGDISPLGIAGNVTARFGGGLKLRANGGAFLLPVGLSDYSGKLYAGQLVLTSSRSSLAGGLFRFSPDLSDTDRLALLDGNGSRAYTVLALNAEYSVPLGKLRVTFGVDLYRNLESYRASPDPASRSLNGERTGYVFSAAGGDTSTPGHFQLGYRHFRIEKLAVNASYAHDDLSRFGSATQSAQTDLRGEDFYMNYRFDHHVTVGARFIFARRITTPERGNRARMDVSYSF